MRMQGVIDIRGGIIPHAIVHIDHAIGNNRQFRADKLTLCPYIVARTVRLSPGIVRSRSALMHPVQCAERSQLVLLGERTSSERVCGRYRTMDKFPCSPATAMGGLGEAKI